MKKIFIFAAALFAAVSCNEAGVEEVSTDATAGKTAMTISVAANSSADTKVSVDATGDVWNTTWDDGENLLVSEINGCNETFIMTSHDDENATFTGYGYVGYDYRLIAPCPASPAFYASETYAFDYSSQKAGLTATHIISPDVYQFAVNYVEDTNFTNEAVNFSMTHVGAAIDLQTRFTGVSGDYTLKSVALTSNYILNGITVNITKPVDDENFISEVSYGPIKITDIDAAVAEYSSEADQVSVKFNIPAPFTIYGDYVEEDFNLEYTFVDATGAEVTVDASIAAIADDVEFARGTYNTIKAYCDLSGVGGNATTTFDIAVTNITTSDADIAVTPSNDDTLYAVVFYESSYVSDATEFFTNEMATLGEQGLTFNEPISDYTYKGSMSTTGSAMNYFSLDPSTEYIVMVGGVDSEGNPSTDVVWETFTTDAEPIVLETITLSAVVDGNDATITATPSSTDFYYSVAFISVQDLVIDYGVDNIDSSLESFITAEVEALFNAQSGGKPSNWKSAGYCYNGTTEKLASAFYNSSELSANTDYYAVALGYANSTPLSVATTVASTQFKTGEAATVDPGTGDGTGDSDDALASNVFSLSVTSTSDDSASINLTLNNMTDWGYKYFVVCEEYIEGTTTDDDISKMISDLMAINKYYNGDDYFTTIDYDNLGNLYSGSYFTIDAKTVNGNALEAEKTYYFAAVSVTEDGTIRSEMQYITFTMGDSSADSGDSSNTSTQFAVEISNIAVLNASYGTVSFDIEITTDITDDYVIYIVSDMYFAGWTAEAYLTSSIGKAYKCSGGSQTISSTSISSYIYSSYKQHILIAGVDSDNNFTTDVFDYSFTPTVE